MQQLTHQDENVTTFKELIQFNIYEGKTGNKPCKILRYNELHQVFTQSTIYKDSRNLITLVTLKDSNIADKTESNIADHSRTIIIDLDWKTEIEQSEFLRDYKNGIYNDISMAASDLLSDLKNDPSVFISGYSASGKGIRIIYMVANRYNNKPIHADGLEMFKLSHHLNYEFIVSHLTEKYNLLSGPKYFDNSPKSISLGSYALQPTDFYYNPECNIILNPNRITEEITSIVSEQKISKDQLTQLNNEFIDILYKINDVETEIEKFIQYVRKNLLAYNFSFLSSVKALPEEGRRVFYSIYRKYYILDNHNNPKILAAIRSYTDWNSFLDKLVVKYCTPMLTHFKNSKLDYFNTNHIIKGQDIFGHRYTDELNYENYIHDVKENIFNVFRNNKIAVLKAPAGGGKTTLLIEYIINYLKDNSDKNVCFTAPKLIILKQIVADHAHKFQNIIINYDSTPINLEQLSEGGNIIFSTYQSLDKLHNNYDLLIVDEAHDLVLYSDFDRFLREVNAADIIYLSATPEPLLPVLLQDNPFYLNLTKENIDNPLLITYWVNDTLSKLEDLVNPNRSQLVYLNDKPLGNKLKEKYSQKGIDFKLLNADTKNEPHFQEIINQSILGHTHYIATEVLIEGINILNEKWDDIIIVNNNSSTILHYYQLANRFRKISNINFYYISKYENHDQEVDIDLSKSFSLTKSQIASMVSGLTAKESYIDIMNNDYLDKKDGHYIVNDYKLANKLFRETYRRIHNNRDYFKHFFGFYFTLAEFFRYDKPENDIKEPNLIDFKEFYELNHENINLYFIGVRRHISDEMEQFILVNKKYLKKLYERRKLADTNGLSGHLIYESDIEFNNHVKIAQFKLISSRKDIQGHDLVVKNSLLVIDDIISNAKFLGYKGKKYILLDDVYNLIPKDVLISLSLGHKNNFSRILKYKYNIQRKQVYTYEGVEFSLKALKGLNLIETKKLSFIIL